MSRNISGYGTLKTGRNQQGSNSMRIRITPVIPNESTHTPRFSQTTVSHVYPKQNVEEQRAKRLETEIEGLRNEVKLLQEHLKIAEEKYGDFAYNDLGVQSTITMETASSSVSSAGIQRAQEISEMKNESAFLEKKITSLKGVLTNSSIHDLQEEVEEQRKQKENDIKQYTETENQIDAIHQKIEELKQTDQNKQIYEQKDQISLLNVRIKNEVWRFKQLKYVASGYENGYEFENEEEIDQLLYAQEDIEIKELEDYLSQIQEEYNAKLDEYEALQAREDFSALVAEREIELEKKTKKLQSQQQKMYQKMQEEKEQRRRKEQRKQIIHRTEEILERKLAQLQ